MGADARKLLKSSACKKANFHGQNDELQPFYPSEKGWNNAEICYDKGKINQRNSCVMASNYEKIFYRDYERPQSENAQLIEKNRTLSDEGKLLQKIYEIERAENERNKARIQALEEAVQEAKAQNEALKKEVARLNGIINLDGTNSGTPTSKTPLNKKKVIPNSRRKTGAKKGGQPGHPKSKLRASRTIWWSRFPSAREIIFRVSMPSSFGIIWSRKIM